MKVVLIDSFYLEEFGYEIEKKIFADHNIQFRMENCRTKQQILDCCRDADVLLSVYTSVDGEMMDAFPNCKGLIRYGVGYDAFDLDAASQRGILVCNIPDYCYPEVATHTMALILNACRQVCYFTKQVKAGKWNDNSGIVMRRPESQTLGLAGFGNIARLVAEYARPFGFSMVAYDPYVSTEVFQHYGVRPVTLKELFSTADIISCHIPLSKATCHLFDKDAFRLMKDGAILINTSRGSLVHEGDLIEALRSGKLAAAALDVTESEPIRTADHPFASMDNVILTPHMAYNSLEASGEQHKRVAETAVRILSGELPWNTVNQKELLNHGYLRNRR